MSWDGYNDKPDLAPEPVRLVDAFIRAHWPMLLFAAMLIFFFVFPFFAPPEVPDFILLNRQ